MKINATLFLAIRAVVTSLFVVCLIFVTKDYVPGGVTEKTEKIEDLFTDSVTQHAADEYVVKQEKVSNEKDVQKLANVIVTTYRTVPLPKAEQYVRTAVAEGKRQNVDPTLVLAVCGVESSYRPEVVSGNDHGLMQVNTVWQKEVTKEVGGAEKLLEPKHNLYAGTKVLGGYLQLSKNNEYRALRRYNGLYKENDYPEKVLALAGEFRKALRG